MKPYSIIWIPIHTKLAIFSVIRFTWPTFSCFEKKKNSKENNFLLIGNSDVILFLFFFVIFFLRREIKEYNLLSLLDWGDFSRAAWNMLRAALPVIKVCCSSSCCDCCCLNDCKCFCRWWWPPSYGGPTHLLYVLYIEPLWPSGSVGLTGGYTQVLLFDLLPVFLFPPFNGQIWEKNTWLDSPKVITYII